MKPWAILSPVLAAIATATVAYLARNRRIPRTLQAAGKAIRQARRDLLAHTNAVLYTVVIVGLAVNYWELQTARTEITRTHAALCSERDDLTARLRTNLIEFNHPHVFGLSPIALQTLEATITSERSTIAALHGLGC